MRVSNSLLATLLAIPLTLIRAAPIPAPISCSADSRLLGTFPDGNCKASLSPDGSPVSTQSGGGLAGAGDQLGSNASGQYRKSRGSRSAGINGGSTSASGDEMSTSSGGDPSSGSGGISSGDGAIPDGGEGIPTGGRRTSDDGDSFTSNDPAVVEAMMGACAR